jgi:hypothetical protein
MIARCPAHRALCDERDSTKASGYTSPRKRPSRISRLHLLQPQHLLKRIEIPVPMRDLYAQRFEQSALLPEMLGLAHQTAALGCPSRARPGSPTPRRTQPPSRCISQISRHKPSSSGKTVNSPMPASRRARLMGTASIFGITILSRRSLNSFSMPSLHEP